MTPGIPQLYNRRMKAKRNLGLIRLARLLLLAVGCMVCHGANGAMDMFLKIQGVPGESNDATHNDEIEVLAWSWGMSNPTSTHPGGSAGAVSFQDLCVTKYVDKASPLLMLACASTQHLDAVLYVRSVGPSPVEFLTITIPDLLVSSVVQTATTSEDRPTETVTLNFAEIEYSYVPQELGGPEPPVVFQWDLNNPMP